LSFTSFENKSKTIAPEREYHIQDRVPLVAVRRLMIFVAMCLGAGIFVVERFRTA